MTPSSMPGGLAVLAGLMTIGAAASAQQVGDVVPESDLTGPAYSLSGPQAPAAPRIWRRGDDVERAYILGLQRALPTHGYATGPATGQLDPKTERAVLAYQLDAGLPRDARSVAALKATLDHVTFARPAVFAGQHSTTEAALSPPVPASPEAPPVPAAPSAEPPPAAPAQAPIEQQAAAPAGVPASGAPAADTIRFVQERLKARGYSIEVNGELDTYTVNAVKVFQAANGLPRDGKIDGYLLDLLKQ